jgi:hypothetical protein
MHLISKCNFKDRKDRFIQYLQVVYIYINNYTAFLMAGYSF